MDFTNHHLILVRHYFSGGLALIFIGFGLLTTELIVLIGQGLKSVSRIEFIFCFIIAAP